MSVTSRASLGIWATVMCGVLWVSGCGADPDDGQEVVAPSSATITMLTSTTNATATSARPSGTCAARIASGVLVETLAFGSDSARGVVSTYRDERMPPAMGSLLQLTYADGRTTAPKAVPTPDLLAVVHVGSDGRLGVLVANDGNTARSGSIYIVDGCDIAQTLGGDGAPFFFVYFGEGLSCAPACYPSLHCERVDDGFEVTVSDARPVVDLSASVPSLTDDLLFQWRSERFRLLGTSMVSLGAAEGTTTHGRLSVPKRQGVDCTDA